MMREAIHIYIIATGAVPLRTALQRYTLFVCVCWDIRKNSSVHCSCTEFIFLTSSYDSIIKNPTDVMWRATILCSVGPFYKHRPINLDTPQRSIAHARTYTRNIIRTIICAGFSSEFVLFSELLMAYNRFGRAYIIKSYYIYMAYICTYVQ